MECVNGCSFATMESGRSCSWRFCYWRWVHSSRPPLFPHPPLRPSPRRSPGCSTRRKALRSRPVGGGSQLVAWEPRSWPPPRSRAATCFRALGGSARMRRLRLHDDSESPWSTYPYLARPESPAARRPTVTGRRSWPRVASQLSLKSRRCGSERTAETKEDVPAVGPTSTGRPFGRRPIGRRRPPSAGRSHPLLQHSPPLAARPVSEQRACGP